LLDDGGGQGFGRRPGGVGGLLGAVSTGLLCRWLGPLPVITLCCAASGLALILIGAASSMPVLLAGSLTYVWAIIAASVTNRSLRQVLVPRNCWAGSPPPGGSAARRPP
jgi:predicted MFS family arabinose efflux permease